MTFDELWRLDLAPNGGLTSSMDTSAEAGCVDCGASNGYVFADLDETEMNRFVEWLENSLLSVDTARDLLT
jgi:hypothetical protein